MVNEMIFDFAVRSIIGTREEQQDCVGVTELSDGLLGIVCDGMGGMTRRACKPNGGALSCGAFSDETGRRQRSGLVPSIVLMLWTKAYAK